MTGGVTTAMDVAPPRATAPGSGPVQGPPATATPANTPDEPRAPWLRPLVPIAAGPRLALGIAFFVVFVAGWSVVTFGGFVSKTFLADPLTMLKSGWVLLTQMGFLTDIGMTVWRVLGGFVVAAVVALPLGILMGTYKPIEAFFEPFVSFARYLPASAFIPLLILWAGIGEAQKLAVIFIGSFFQLVLMIAVAVGNTRRDLVEAAYTLGVGDSSLIRRVMLPGAAPEIAEILRMVLGWAWTYVIVAELIGASSGIGHMITDSQALLATDQIIFGIIVIGLIGLASDLLFKWANRRLFLWAQLGR
jgi:NitT/TauT family transport system permease protein